MAEHIYKQHHHRNTVEQVEYEPLDTPERAARREKISQGVVETLSHIDDLVDCPQAA